MSRPIVLTPWRIAMRQILTELQYIHPSPVYEIAYTFFRKHLEHTVLGLIASDIQKLTPWAEIGVDLYWVSAFCEMPEFFRAMPGLFRVLSQSINLSLIGPPAWNSVVPEHREARLVSLLNMIGNGFKDLHDSMYYDYIGSEGAVVMTRIGNILSNAG